MEEDALSSSRKFAGLVEALKDAQEEAVGTITALVEKNDAQLRETLGEDMKVYRVSWMIACPFFKGTVEQILHRVVALEQGAASIKKERNSCKKSCNKFERILLALFTT